MIMDVRAHLVSGAARLTYLRDLLRSNHAARTSGDAVNDGISRSSALIRRTVDISSSRADARADSDTVGNSPSFLAVGLGEHAGRATFLAEGSPPRVCLSRQAAAAAICAGRIPAARIEYASRARHEPPALHRESSTQGTSTRPSNSTAGG
jgi:hypothetical protein